ncbi:MAG: molybdopterin molybdotransferase MoeA [Lachnospiraceae bacterium]|nr:molybdopterin molybdotransferase MoeA [Lachnospiraceae bacterium]
MEIEEAIGLITANTKKIEDRIEVALEDAYGCILAEDITARAAVPAFARSAMDGYAVRSEDTKGASADKPVRLKVVSEILAGDNAACSYEEMTAVRIMTGAMIPDGYDAVVKQEDTDLGEEEVNIFSPVAQYTNYCHIGEEIQKGDKVLAGGKRIGMIETGLAASLGMDRIKVIRPVKVGIISTGSELTSPGRELAKGCIYGNIRYMINAAVKSIGFEVSCSADCPDDKDEICAQITKAASMSDVVITTGGVSVGKRDLVVGALSDIGARRLFSRVNIQPGTPTIASVYDDRIILGLSGNPFAALANFDLYFPPLCAKLTGCPELDTKTAEAVLCDPYEKVSRLRRLVRAYEDSGKVYLPVQKHMSSVFGNLDRCNCYIDIPADERISVGDTVKIRRMRYR